MLRSVAFLGPSGSYTHQAALNWAKNQATLVPQVTIRDVFDAVLRGSVTHGIVPIENSTNGSVTITFDLFRDLKHGNLKVCGEQFVQVKHSLLANCQLQEIQRIYSHPQVLSASSLSLTSGVRAVRAVAGQTSQGSRENQRLFHKPGSSLAKRRS